MACALEIRGVCGKIFRDILSVSIAGINFAGLALFKICGGICRKYRWNCGKNRQSRFCGFIIVHKKTGLRAENNNGIFLLQKNFVETSAKFNILLSCLTKFQACDNIMFVTAV